MTRREYFFHEEHRLTGQWWQPDSDRRAVGTMSFHESGFVLTTHGRSMLPPVELEPDKQYPNFWERAQIGAVWGTTDSHVDVTLFDLEGHRFALPGESAGEETWRPSVALIGTHITPDVLFDRLVVRTEHLDDWAGTPRLDIELSGHEDGRALSTQARAERRTLEVAEVDGFGTVEIEAIPVGSAGGRQATIGLRGVFSVTPPTAAGWRRCFALATALREFCRLLIGTSTGFETISLRCAGTSDWVQLLRRTAYAAQGSSTKVDSFDMLLRREDVPRGFGPGFARWMQIRDVYLRAWSPLTSDDRRRVIDARERFVQRSRAVEVFHAKDFGSSVSAVEERDSRVAKALAQISEDDGLRDWARPLLEASTPPVARHRVMELVESLGFVGTELAGGDVETFARYVVNTRNDVTHQVTRSKAVLTEDEDIFWFGISLEWIATLYLLQRLGVGATHLQEITGRNGRAMAAALHVSKFLAEVSGSETGGSVA